MTMKTYNLLYENLENVKIKGVTKTNIPKFKNWEFLHFMICFIFFPRAYENRNNHKKIGDILADEFVILQGTVVNVANQYIKSGRTMFRAVLSDDSGMIELVWFNNRFVKNGIHIGDEITVYGKVRKTMKFQLVNPEYKKLPKIVLTHRNKSKSCQFIRLQNHLDSRQSEKLWKMHLWIMDICCRKICQRSFYRRKNCLEEKKWF